MNESHGSTNAYGNLHECKSLHTIGGDRPRKKMRQENAIDSVMLLTEIGISNYLRGDHSKAEQCFSQALCRVGATSRNGRIESLMSKCRTDGDNFSTEPSLTDQEDGSDKAHRTEYDEGMRFYDSPLPLSDLSNPEHVTSTLYYNIGQTYSRQGHYARASAWFNKSLAAGGDISSLLVVKALHSLGYCSYRLRNEDIAMQYYKKALSLVSDMGLSGSVHFAASLNCVGVLHFNKQTNSSDLAMDMFAESLRIYRSLKSSSPPAVATVLNNIGRVHYLQSEFEAALEKYEESLLIRRDFLGADSIDVAATVYNIGQTCHQLGHLDHSLTQYNEFLRIAKSTIGPASRDAALAYRGIAEIYHEKNDIKMALYYFSQALEAQQVEDAKGTEVATTLNKMGNLCYEMKDFAAAMNYYEKGLELERSILAANHPHTIITLTNIAHIHKQLGQHEHALKAYISVFNMQSRTFGGESLNVAETLSSIGLMQYHLRDYESSFESYQEALRIRRHCFGTDDHPDVASTLNSVGLVLFKQGLLDLAKKCFGESLRIRTQLLGKDHRDTAILWYNIATIYFEMGEDDLAIEMYKETLRVERKSLGGDHPDVVLTLQHLGQIHQQIGQIEKALSYFNEALEIERCRKEPKSGPLGRILNLLGNIYLQLGRADNMMRCYVEASRIYEANQIAGETLVIAGYNFYGLSKTNPPCAPVA
jgi:tetratricopeptide (TPR) repeat protein